MSLLLSACSTSLCKSRMSVLVLMANFFSMYFARMNSLRSSLHANNPKRKKKVQELNRTEPVQEATHSYILYVCMLHCAVQVRLGNVQRSLHNLIETVVGHVPGDEQLRRRHMIQLSSTRKTEGEKGQNKRYYHQSNSIALLQLTDLCAHQ